MKLIFHSMRVYAARIAQSMFIKFLGAVTELLIPFILEHLIDEVVPLGRMDKVLLWGMLMVFTALITRQLNVWANRIAIDNAHNVSFFCPKGCSYFVKRVTPSGEKGVALM